MLPSSTLFMVDSFPLYDNNLDWLLTFASISSSLPRFQLKTSHFCLLYIIPSGLSNPRLFAFCFYYFCKYIFLINSVNSRIVCVFYFYIYSTKLDLFDPNCFIIQWYFWNFFCLCKLFLTSLVIFVTLYNYNLYLCNPNILTVWHF